MTEDPVITHGGFHPDYSEEIKYFKECKIYAIQIESNLVCNQGCLYCYASNKNAPIKELAKTDVISIIDSAVKLKVKAIDWLGGDPLLRSNWFELMSYAKKKGLINNIWTSGLPLENIEIVKKALSVSKGGFISVHLDSLDEKIYGKSHSGNPKKKIAAILEGVDNVQSLGKKPQQMINCITFTKHLVKDVRKTIKFFFEQKGMRTCLTQMCLTGLAEEHNDWVPTNKEIEDACRIRDEINYAGSTHSFSSMDTNKFYCGGIICITVDGEVTPCSVIRKGFGNIHFSTLGKIIEKNKNQLLYTQLRNIQNMPGNCKTCKDNSVCWGCRASAYYESGDLYGIDPKCYKNINVNSC